MTDDPEVDAARVWLEQTPQRVPTDDERKALTNRMGEYQSFFGPAALAAVVKDVQAKRRGRPKSADVAAENAVLHEDYQDQKAADPSMNPRRYAQENAGARENPDSLERRVGRLLKAECEIAELWDDVLKRGPPDEEAWPDDEDAVPVYDDGAAWLGASEK